MPPTDFRIGILGSRGFSRWILEHLLGEGWTVPLAVGASGNLSSQQAGATSFADLCADENITLVETDDIGSEAIVEQVRDAELDVAICCGWTQIVPERVLEIPAEGFIGLHASPLPEGRGGAPVNWQIIKGREKASLSLFEFVPEVDHGDVLAQTTVPIQARDDISTVYDRLTVAAFDLLDHTLPAMASGTVGSRPQSFADATYWPQRKPQDGLVEWERGASAQHDWIRGLTKPYPGAFTFFRGEKLTIWQASILDETLADPDAGEVIETIEGSGIDVCSGGERLRLERVQFGNGPSMWADDLADRIGLSTGTVLGKPTDFPEWLYTGLRGPDGGFDYETNVSVGDTATNIAICRSHASTREVRVEATFDGDTVLEQRLQIVGTVTQELEIEVQTRGSHTLKFVFTEDGDVIDVRYLNIYAAASTTTGTDSRP